MWLNHRPHAALVQLISKDRVWVGFPPIPRPTLLLPLVRPSLQLREPHSGSSHLPHARRCCKGNAPEPSLRSPSQSPALRTAPTDWRWPDERTKMRKCREGLRIGDTSNTGSEGTNRCKGSTLAAGSKVQGSLGRELRLKSCHRFWFRSLSIGNAKTLPKGSQPKS